MSPKEKNLVDEYFAKGGAVTRLPETHGETFRKRAIVGHAKREADAAAARAVAVLQILRAERAPMTAARVCALLGLEYGRTGEGHENAQSVRRALRMLVSERQARMTDAAGTLFEAVRP